MLPFPAGRSFIESLTLPAASLPWLPAPAGAALFPHPNLPAMVQACRPAAAVAALYPQTNEPYKVEVVLHVARHRLLTGVFQEQIVRELQDSLRAGAGHLADVKLVREHPRLAAVLEKGLGPALDVPG